MMAASMSAVITSNTECCFKNTVENKMEIHKIRENALVFVYLFNFSQLAIAMCAISEL